MALGLLGLAGVAHDQGDSAGVRAHYEPSLAIFHLEGLAGVVAEQAADLAVWLLAPAALRAQMGTPLWPTDRGAVEHALATARSTRGDNAFAVAWAAALPLEQILTIIRT